MKKIALFNFRNIIVVFLCIVLIGIGQNVLAQKLDISQLENMKARSIGPAGMSGRIVAIDAIESNPDIIYAGAASGGVWK